MKKILLLSIALLSASFFTLQAQTEPATGPVKIKYRAFFGDHYLGAVTLANPVVRTLFGDDGNDEFYLDKVGDSYLIISGIAGRPGDLVMGDYIFADTNEGFDEANCFFYSGSGYFPAIWSIRKDSILYVIGPQGSYSTDVLALETAAKAGQIKRINLNQANNFSFNFVDSEDTPEDAFQLKLDNGAYVTVNDMSGNLQVSESLFAPFAFESFPDNWYLDVDYAYVKINMSGNELFLNAGGYPPSTQYPDGLYYLGWAGAAITENTVFKLEKAGVSGGKTYYTLYCVDLNMYLADARYLGKNPDGTTKDQSYLDIDGNPKLVFQTTKDDNCLFAFTGDESSFCIETRTGGYIANNNGSPVVSYVPSKAIVFTIAETGKPDAVVALPGASVWMSGKTLYINTTSPTVTYIYSVNGDLVKTLPAGAVSATLPQGVYVVKVGDATAKVVVR